MKVNKYQIPISISDETYYYDLIKNSICKIDTLISEKLNQGDIDSLDNKVREQLKQDNILLPCEVDEFNLFIKKYNMMTLKNKSLDIVIIASTSCNFKCTYCYQSLSKVEINQQFEKRFIKFLKTNITSFKSVLIEWFGGEPLLSFDRIITLSEKIIEICKENKKPYVASMTTNGYYLTHQRFLKLLDVKVVSYQITIDGDENAHNMLRPLINGSGTYSTIINNLKDIQEKIGDRRYYNITIRNNICKQNINNFNDFLIEYELFFKKNKKINLLPYPIGDWGGDRIKKLENLLLKDGNDIINQNKFDDLKIHNNINKNPENMVCYAAKRYGVTIDPHGNIYKCSHYILEDLREQKANKIGILSDNNDYYLENLKYSNNILSNASDMCVKCNKLPYCVYNCCPLYGLQPKDNCKAEIEKEIINSVERYLEIL